MAPGVSLEMIKIRQDGWRKGWLDGRVDGRVVCHLHLRKMIKAIKLDIQDYSHCNNYMDS